MKRYSAEKEHEIFYALCKAQDKAEAESYNSHPDPHDFEAQNSMQQRLSEKYEASLRRKYRFSEDEQASLTADGFDAGWALHRQPPSVGRLKVLALFD